jgi:hypothetical protein
MRNTAADLRHFFTLWARRNLHTYLSLICFRFRVRRRLALLKWNKRCAPAKRREVGQKSKGLALLALKKFWKRPFTAAKAFRRWSLDWHWLLRRIIFNLAYETSINEQIAFWRWKRVLQPKRMQRPAVVMSQKA